MLVLSRHRDESIIIGDDVVVTIVDIRGDKVRLGIQAPQDIPVHRQEVYEAIKRENEKSARLEPSDTHAIEALSYAWLRTSVRRTIRQGERAWGSYPVPRHGWKRVPHRS